MAGLHHSYAFGAYRVAVFRDDDSTLQPAAKNRLDRTRHGGGRFSSSHDHDTAILAQVIAARSDRQDVAGFVDSLLHSLAAVHSVQRVLQHPDQELTDRRSRKLHGMGGQTRAGISSGGGTEAIRLGISC